MNEQIAQRIERDLGLANLTELFVRKTRRRRSSFTFADSLEAAGR